MMTKVFAMVLPVVGLMALGAAAGRAPTTNKIERGRYLVERAAMCTDCHTQHNEQGEPVANQNLRGAPLPFRPTVQMPWAEFAPNIAGLPSMATEQAIEFLTTGKLDRPMRPPMPAYRFERQDAEAIVAYLKSLEPTTTRQ